MRSRKDQLSGESGAVAVMVALMLVVLVGVGAVAIDLGSAWATKRAMVTDTDAASLAGAHALGAHVDNCASSEAINDVRLAVDNYLDANGIGSDALSGNPRIACDDETGKVEVVVQGEAGGFFSGVLGVARIEPRGLSVAEFTLAPPEGDYLPYAACDRTFPDAGRHYLPSKNNIDVPAAQRCPGTSQNAGHPNQPGNWGWLKGSSDCTSETRDWCGGVDTGNNNVNQANSDLPARCLEADPKDCDRFTILIFDKAQGQGSGAEYHVIGYAVVVPRGCSSSDGGSLQDCQGNPNYLVWDVIHMVTGDDQPAFEPLFMLPEVSLCGVDGDNAGDRCLTSW